jgi:hypothetical protein
MIRGSRSRGFEEFCLLGYNAVWSIEIQPTFRRNISPGLATCFHVGILLGLFDPEDGGDMFLRNVG